MPHGIISVLDCPGLDDPDNGNVRWLFPMRIKPVLQVYDAIAPEVVPMWNHFWRNSIIYLQHRLYSHWEQPANMSE